MMKQYIDLDTNYTRIVHSQRFVLFNDGVFVTWADTKSGETWCRYCDPAAKPFIVYGVDLTKAEAFAILSPVFDVEWCGTETGWDIQRRPFSIETYARDRFVWDGPKPPGDQGWTHISGAPKSTVKRAQEIIDRNGWREDGGVRIVDLRDGTIVEQVDPVPVPPEPIQLPSSPSKPGLWARLFHRCAQPV